eukprot:6468547-Pyramimonas_sp.AAC.1
MSETRVLHKQFTEFDELSARVNPSAITWAVRLQVSDGNRNIASHMQERSLHKHSKFALMLHLISRGWQS